MPGTTPFCTALGQGSSTNPRPLSTDECHVYSGHGQRVSHRCSGQIGSRALGGQAAAEVHAHLRQIDAVPQATQPANGTVPWVVHQTAANRLRVRSGGMLLVCV